jgi:hypothetical protein
MMRPAAFGVMAAHCRDSFGALPIVAVATFWVFEVRTALELISQESSREASAMDGAI